MLYGYSRTTGKLVKVAGEQEQKTLDFIHKMEALNEVEISLDGVWLCTEEKDIYTDYIEKYGHPIDDDLAISKGNLTIEEWFERIKELNPGKTPREAISEFVFLCCEWVTDPGYKGALPVLPNINKGE